MMFRYALLSLLLAATLRAAWVVELSVCNAASECQTLMAGVNPMATEGLDPDLGESNLPPWPPTSAFHARLLPDGLEGLLLDLRPEQSGSIEYLFGWQTGSAGGPVIISWEPESLPADVDLYLQDPWGGSIVPRTDLRDTNQVSISLSALRRLVFYAVLPDRPCAVSDLHARVSAPDAVLLEWTPVTQSVGGNAMDGLIYEIWARDPRQLLATTTQAAYTLWLEPTLPSRATLEVIVRTEE